MSGKLSKSPPSPNKGHFISAQAEKGSENNGLRPPKRVTIKEGEDVISITSPSSDRATAQVRIVVGMRENTGEVIEPKPTSNASPQAPEEPEEDEDILDLTGMEVTDEDSEENKSDDFPDVEITVQLPQQIDVTMLNKIKIYQQMCDAIEKAANNKKSQEFRAIRACSLRTSLTNLLEDQSMNPEKKEQEIIEIFDKIREVLTEDEVVLAEEIEDLDDI